MKLDKIVGKTVIEKQGLQPRILASAWSMVVSPFKA